MLENRSPIGQIYALMSKAMGDLEPIAKSRTNTSQGYKFRGIDDIYSALNKVLVANNIFFAPNVVSYRREDRETKNGGNAVYTLIEVQYVFWAPDGSCITTCVVGEGMDFGDKATNKAMTAAVKAMLTQVFCITTDDGSDTENDHIETSKPRSTYRQTQGSASSPSSGGRNKKCPHCGKDALQPSAITQGSYWCSKNLGGCDIKGIVLSE